MYLYSDSLILPAVQGAVLTGSTILFLPLIGSWIDLTNRLTTARTLIVVQYLSAGTCCLLLFLFLTYRSSLSSSWELAVYSLVVAVSTASCLAGVSTTLMVQRDWVVVIAGDTGGGTHLANINTIIRTIDLSTAFVSPIVIGQVVG